MEPHYKTIDTTSDIKLKVYGNTLEDIFCQAAKGLFHWLVFSKEIKKKYSLKIEVRGEPNDLQELMVVWLNELLYQYATKSFLGSEFIIEKLISDKYKTQLSAVVWGENYDSGRHWFHTGIKGAIYHLLKINKKDEGYEAQVVLDV